MAAFLFECNAECRANNALMSYDAAPLRDAHMDLWTKDVATRFGELVGVVRRQEEAGTGTTAGSISEAPVPPVAAHAPRGPSSSVRVSAGPLFGVWMHAQLFTTKGVCESKVT